MVVTEWLALRMTLNGWPSKACPSPSAYSGNITMLANTITQLQRLQARIRFHNFPVPVMESGLPDHVHILSIITENIKNLIADFFAASCGLEPADARLAVKFKEAKLKRGLIISNWQNEGHLFVPSSFLAVDGFCPSCSIRPKNFQSFLRRKCESSSLSQSHNSVREALLAAYKRVLRDGFTSCMVVSRVAPSSVGWGGTLPGKAPVYMCAGQLQCRLSS